MSLWALRVFALKVEIKKLKNTLSHQNSLSFWITVFETSKTSFIYNDLDLQDDIQYLYLSQPWLIQWLSCFELAHSVNYWTAYLEATN